jgi:LacI family asc operon transcriptional repressor
LRLSPARWIRHRVERLSGYKDALAQHGIPLREELIAQGKWNPASGAAAVELLRAVNFTALVASNDDMAIGAMKQLHDSGVPRRTRCR